MILEACLTISIMFRGPSAIEAPNRVYKGMGSKEALSIFLYLARSFVLL
ncbi:hypothetical protein Zm00014a_020398 [Zea mays]|uniref:Uncharacterized protein n=1 Tax=Zea mays TaxID=4577 RepID=A0A3L6FEF0_MAIZE|nr:hypothetical protein Zm00014a_020398 [Zea mays]